MNGIVELAKMFKERENQPHMGVQVGTVLTPPPDIRISMGEKIILSNENLIFSAHVLAGYQRQMEIQSDVNLTGNITFTDSLVAGDKVILIPSADEQTYYVMDKVVTL